MSRIARIGVISDTHGVLHPAVAEVFANVDAILHAGDIGGAHILDALRKLAPVTSVDGNNDDATGEEIVRTKLGTLRVLLTHILPRPQQAGVTRRRVVARGAGGRGRLRPQPSAAQRSRSTACATSIPPAAARAASTIRSASVCSRRKAATGTRCTWRWTSVRSTR